MAVVFVPSMEAHVGDYLYPPQIGVDGGGGAGKSIARGSLNIGTPYATDGVVVAATDFDAGASTLHDLKFGSVSDNGLVQYRFVTSTSKVIAQNLTGSEIANGTNLSAAGYNCRCDAVLA